MKFPVFSLLAGISAPETGSLVTTPSTGESLERPQPLEQQPLMLVLRQDLQERLGRQVLSNLFKMCMNGGTYQSFETLLIASQFDSVMLAAFAEGGGILLMSFNDAFDCCVD